MSDLSDIVTLTISQNSVGITRAGFGTAMILSANASFPERIRYYGDLSAVAVDFAVTTSPEYLAAQSLFSQSPRPVQVAIGRSALPPTQVYVISVASVINLQAYKVNVAGQGFTETALTFTSDGTATNDEIVAGLVSALNGVASKNYTAAATGSAGSQVVTVTGNAAGNWFSIEIVDVTKLLSAETHVDPGVATDLDAIVLENDDWYALCTLYNSKAYVTAAAAWAESKFKIYVADVSTTLSVTAAVGGGGNDTLDALHTSAYTRTAGIYHPRPASMAAAGWLGKLLPLDPGSATWKFKTLAGVAATKVTTTHKVNLRAKKGNWYQSIAGVNITQEGTTSDGGFIDVRTGLDWITDDMTKAVFGALAGATKIPFTDPGVAVIENEVRGSLGRAIGQKILSATPAPVVTAPLVADVALTDRANRLLPNIKFTANFAGAVHKVAINGTISV